MMRRAIEGDIPQILELLRQVNLVHYNARPDVFKKATKYTEKELESIICDQNRPIFVHEDEFGIVNGYCFCVFIEQRGSNLLQDMKTLYIDDLCVDENVRGKGVGKKLYEYVVDHAKKEGYYNLTLNVWSCNENALRFYEKMGLVPQKIGMEKIL